MNQEIPASIEHKFLKLKLVLERIFEIMPYADEDAVTGMIGMGSCEASGLQMRYTRPGSQRIRELLNNALWGSTSAMRQLLRLIIKRELKQEDLLVVLKELTQRANGGHRHALELIEQIALEAPGPVLQVIAKHIQSFCKELGNYQAMEAFKPKPAPSPFQLPVPRPKKLPPESEK